MNNPQTTPPTRPTIDEIVQSRCQQFAHELVTEIPEVDAVGFVFASRQLDPAVLPSILVGKHGPVTSPTTLFQLTRALTMTCEHIWGNLLPGLLQGLEELASAKARHIHEQARALSATGMGESTPAPPRHTASPGAEAARLPAGGPHE